MTATQRPRLHTPHRPETSLMPCWVNGPALASNKLLCFGGRWRFGGAHVLSCHPASGMPLSDSHWPWRRHSTLSLDHVVVCHAHASVPDAVDPELADMGFLFCQRPAAEARPRRRDPDAHAPWERDTRTRGCGCGSARGGAGRFLPYRLLLFRVSGFRCLESTAPAPAKVPNPSEFTSVDLDCYIFAHWLEAQLHSAFGERFIGCTHGR